jgi:hypothetical protein
MTESVMLAPGGVRWIVERGLDATVRVPTNAGAFASSLKIVVPPR